MEPQHEKILHETLQIPHVHVQLVRHSWLHRQLKKIVLKKYIFLNNISTSWYDEEQEYFDSRVHNQVRLLRSFNTLTKVRRVLRLEMIMKMIHWRHWLTKITMTFFSKQRHHCLSVHNLSNITPTISLATMQPWSGENVKKITDFNLNLV